MLVCTAPLTVKTLVLRVIQYERVLCLNLVIYHFYFKMS